MLLDDLARIRDKSNKSGYLTVNWRHGVFLRQGLGREFCRCVVITTVSGAF